MTLITIYLQDRQHHNAVQNKSNLIEMKISKTYMNPQYISPCHAGGLFGIISADGLIYPCEILEDKVLGNLRENDMNFMKIWNNQNTSDAKKFIHESKCNCTYECALSYKILGNPRYGPSLLKAAINN